MGYIIIDEEKLHENLKITNDKHYREKVTYEVARAKADYSHLLEALVKEEKKIDEDIYKLQSRKNDIGMLMQLAEMKG